MEIRNGIPVSPGVAIREAYVLDTEEIHIPQRFVEKDDVEAEAARYEQGAQVAIESLNQEIARLSDTIGISAQILETHKILLADPVLRREILESIREKQYTAEHSVARVINHYITKLESLDSPIISERVNDLYDIEKLLLKALLGHRLDNIHNLNTEVVVVCHNLTPAQATKLDPENVKGFATDVGGKTSHTAIIARALGIPAVVGIEDLSKIALAGDIIIVDGFRGIVVVDPDEPTIEEYRDKERNVRKFARRLRKETTLTSESVDGHTVEVNANIENPHEVSSVVELGASGVGLFRTEFLHLANPRADEEWHFKHYKRAVEGLEGLPLTIRTLDLGGDKGMGAESEEEENPFLGCRSIRYCLAHPEMFKQQLRAILRASALGPIKLMFPMVGSMQQIDRSLVYLDQVREDLRSEGVPFEDSFPIGLMMEVPSLAIIADRVAQRVDFMSVGTNDLIQYTLAVDRGNEHVADLYDPVHPAILRLLSEVLRAGRDAGIPVAICGEMAAEPMYIPLLVGLGFRNLSVSPPMIPEVKRIVRSMQVSDVRQLAKNCQELTDGIDIASELKAWGREHLSDIVSRW